MEKTIRFIINLFEIEHIKLLNKVIKNISKCIITVVIKETYILIILFPNNYFYDFCIT